MTVVLAFYALHPGLAGGALVFPHPWLSIIGGATVRAPPEPHVVGQGSKPLTRKLVTRG